MVKKLHSHGLVLKAMTILLVVIFFSLTVVEGKMVSRKKIMEARRKIYKLKSNAVRSIQSEDGDIIDCIDIYKQPGLDHPALKNHIIQMTPSHDPNMDSTTEIRELEKNSKDSSLNLTPVPHVWQKSGSCPAGTVPIRRPRERELLKANSVEEYARKTPSFSPPLTPLTDKENLTYRISNRSVAILLAEGYSYSGIKGDIKVWNPRVDFDDEYSSSRVNLRSGPPNDYECVESGWVVNPSLYGDRQSRFYVYWTRDGSRKTGCFDVTCPGFVQTSSEIALGAAIYPTSKPNGLPYQITLYVFKDYKTSNWWVQYGEKTNVGYWPGKLFTLLQAGNAEMAEWGGEVFSTRLGHGPHTTTAMGNGNFADFIFQNSGYFKRMRIRENSLQLKLPEWVSTYTDEYRCYNARYVSDYLLDPEFYYGGPGRNYFCH